MRGSCAEALLFSSPCCLTTSRHRVALIGAVVGVTLFVLLRVLIIDTLVWNDNTARSASSPWSGALQDSVELVRKISSDIQEASVKPYNLSRVDTSDFSQNGQSCYIAGLFESHGVSRTFLEAGAYNGEDLSNTLYLERNLGWSGLLVEPDPWSFWALRRRNRKARLLQACLSPTTSASMMTLKQSGEMSRLRKPEEVGQRGIFAAVACYPLYAVMQASGLTELDYLALDLEGAELQVLQTLPWNTVNITVVQVEASHLDSTEAGKNSPKKKSTRNFQRSLPLQPRSTPAIRHRTPVARRDEASHSRVARSKDMTSEQRKALQHIKAADCVGTYNTPPTMDELSPGQKQLVELMAKHNYKFLTSIGEDFIFRKSSTRK
ncbi:Methyltransferase FkbM [Trinorchestia longiramus]|nr:Methyltransferase FkbM [Trinorchestia longiramus]